MRSPLVYQRCESYPSGGNVGSTTSQEMSYVHARPRSPPPVPLRATPATSTQEVPLPPLWASLPPEHRRRLSQIMARVIAQPSLPRQQEVPDD